MRLSLVIPVFNEEEALMPFLETLSRVVAEMDFDYEIVFVDDGSRDQTRQLLETAARSDPRIKVLRLSRNFGHQAAITAGLDFATGDAVVVMDADLQDPPELLSEMVARFQEGFDVVSAQRSERDGDGLFKRLTAALFYRLMRRTVDSRLVPQVGDFRLFSRAAVVALRRFREQHRFMRGLVAWLGLREAIVPFRRPARIAGKTKYPPWKMLRFAWTAISSFSALPLKLSFYGGAMMCAVGSLTSAFLLCTDAGVSEWSVLGCVQLVLSGVTLIAIGLVGDYVARIYEEAKGRPLYVVSETLNLNPGVQCPERAVCLTRGGNDATAERTVHEMVDYRRPGLDGPVGLSAERLGTGGAALSR
jgi:dolichol-phosphate mannosyltransferase